MAGQQELYGVRVGSVYFTGVGDAGFRLDKDGSDTLILQNARVRTLKDPSIGLVSKGVYAWNEKHLRTLFNYIPNNDAISSITFNRNGIDHLVACLLQGNNV